MKISDVQFSDRGTVIVARVTGEIDLSNADDIGSAVQLEMPNRSRVLIFDLTEVEYLDSAGIGLIYRLMEKLHSRGQTLRLVVPANSAANDALRLAGVSSTVTMLDNVDDALVER